MITNTFSHVFIFFPRLIQSIWKNKNHDHITVHSSDRQIKKKR